jgi:hypothetical protein
MGAVTLREKHKLMEFENKVFRKIGVLRNVEQNEATEYCEIQSFTICNPYRILFTYLIHEF